MTLITEPATHERMDVLDAVRGVAVLGILFVNIESLSGYGFASPAVREAAPLAEWNGPAEAFVAIFIEAKFYALFSLLFGVGFSVFVARAAARGADAVRLFKRRLVGLLLIGLVHTVFIWFGDILVTYAILGFGLLPFLRSSDRTLLRWAVGLLLLPAVLYLVAAVAVALFAPPAGRGPGEELPPVMATAVDSFAQGTYPQIVLGNIVFTIANVLRRLGLMFFPRVFAMFLIGLYVGRSGMLANVAARRASLRRVAGWGFAAGVPLAIIGAVLPDRLPMAAAVAVDGVVTSLAIPALTLAYAAGLCLIFEWMPSLLRAFAAPGRMALSNYLLHSVVGVTLFYGIGFGYFGRLSLPVALAAAVGFFALQMVASRLWLQWAAFGPAEWVWRMFTYGRRFSLFTPAH